MAIGEWLVAHGAKALVVACNTATAQSIALVRERLAIPLIGVEPGVKPAALESKTRVVGVLATAVTLRSAALSGAARPLRRRLPLHLPAGPRTRAGRRALRYRLARTDARCCASYLQPMLDAGADTLVLGCTHYPFLDEAIRVDRRRPAADRSIRASQSRGNSNAMLDAARPARPPAASAIVLPRFYSTGTANPSASWQRTLLGIDARGRARRRSPRDALRRQTPSARPERVFAPRLASRRLRPSARAPPAKTLPTSCFVTKNHRHALAKRVDTK